MSQAFSSNRSRIAKGLTSAALAALLLMWGALPAQAVIDAPVPPEPLAPPDRTLRVDGGWIEVVLPPGASSGDVAVVLAHGQRLVDLLERDLGPLGRGGTPGRSEVQTAPFEGQTAESSGPFGRVIWSNWPDFARDLWNLWWQGEGGTAALLQLPPAPAGLRDLTGPGTNLPLSYWLARGVAEFWLEQALVRTNLEPLTDFTTALARDRSEYEQGLQAGPTAWVDRAWLRAAGRLTGLYVDDWLRHGPPDGAAANLAGLLRALRLHPDLPIPGLLQAVESQRFPPVADPAHTGPAHVRLAGLAGLAEMMPLVAEATGRDVTELAALLRDGTPLPLGPLFEPASGQEWPAFWDRVREQEFASVTVIVDGRSLPMEVAPVQQGGRTLVPLRAIFEALGASVDYEEATRQVTAAKGGRRVVLWQEEHLARIDGRLLWLDVVPTARQGRTLVPIRFVSEALGAAVDWVGPTRTVLIKRAAGPLAPLPPEPVEGRKIAYLTFDDGPSAEHTAVILDTLKRYGVPATFFVVGRYVEAFPALVEREVREGHAVGNHSYDHDYRRIYTSPEAFLKSVEQADEAIFRATGQHPRLVRAPGGTAGNFTPAYFELLHRYGYSVYDWNVSTADSVWPRPTAEDIVTNVAAYSFGGSIKWIIILMHDGTGHASTVLALPEVIRYLVRQGYLLRALEPGGPLSK